MSVRGWMRFAMPHDRASPGGQIKRRGIRRLSRRWPCPNLAGIRWTTPAARLEPVKLLQAKSTEVDVAEVFVQFTEPVVAKDGRTYVARACGGETEKGMWQGWIEFLPISGGEAVRSSRETTQPNRQDTEYWATGLTPVYLEGSLNRSLHPPTRMSPIESTAIE